MERYELPNADSLLEARQIWQEVYAAIYEIEPARGKRLVLLDVRKVSAKEVAGAVELTVPLFKWRLHRMR